ncbi:hypothetical protein DD237_006378 [Peronospora effusa]|uniref:Uncharacterized protein n=1 Tax=Peronospora effusa TaxID=542832 RepID=A0A3R7YXW5_9STRA|nr:hypothetical protein DD237_006378 [Peronospora effusa]
MTLYTLRAAAITLLVGDNSFSMHDTNLDGDEVTIVSVSESVADDHECEKVLLIGVRYKSLVRLDFDICEDDENSGKWMSYELFIKTTEPLRMPKHKQWVQRSEHAQVEDGWKLDRCSFTKQAANEWNILDCLLRFKEPGTMHDLKFSSRRGGKINYRDKNGYHHGHHGKFGHLRLHGSRSVPFKGPPHHLCSPRDFVSIGSSPHHESLSRLPGTIIKAFLASPDINNRSATKALLVSINVTIHPS